MAWLDTGLTWGQAAQRFLHTQANDPGDGLDTTWLRNVGGVIVAMHYRGGIAAAVGAQLAHTPFQYSVTGGREAVNWAEGHGTTSDAEEALAHKLLWGAQGGDGGEFTETR